MNKENLQLLLLGLILLGVIYLIFRGFPDIKDSPPVINIEQDLTRIKDLLYTQDSIDRETTPNITKIEHHWHQISAMPKINDGDSLLESANKLLQE